MCFPFGLFVCSPFCDVCLRFAFVPVSSFCYVCVCFVLLFVFRCIMFVCILISSVAFVRLVMFVVA